MNLFRISAGQHKKTDVFEEVLDKPVDVEFMLRASKGYDLLAFEAKCGFDFGCLEKVSKSGAPAGAPAGAARGALGLHPAAVLQRQRQEAEPAELEQAHGAAAAVAARRGAARGLAWFRGNGPPLATAWRVAHIGRQMLFGFTTRCPRGHANYPAFIPIGCNRNCDVGCAIVAIRIASVVDCL